MQDDWPLLIEPGLLVVLVGLYFVWQRRRYLAGKRVWFPALLFNPLMFLTGHRFEKRETESNLAQCVELRNSQRIARFLKRADDLRMREKRPDGLLPGRPSGGSGTGDGDVTGQG